MKFLRTYFRLLLACILAFVMQVSFAAFVGKSDDQKNKFNLRGLNSVGKAYSLSSLRANTFVYRGSQEIYQQNKGDKVQVQSMIRMERGNTTYVYPYKYIVKVPKFKTPTAPLNR